MDQVNLGHIDRYFKNTKPGRIIHFEASALDTPPTNYLITRVDEWGNFWGELVNQGEKPCQSKQVSSGQPSTALPSSVQSEQSSQRSIHQPLASSASSPDQLSPSTSRKDDMDATVLTGSKTLGTFHFLSVATDDHNTRVYQELMKDFDARGMNIEYLLAIEESIEWHCLGRHGVIYNIDEEELDDILFYIERMFGSSKDNGAWLFPISNDDVPGVAYYHIEFVFVAKAPYPPQYPWDFCGTSVLFQFQSK